MRVDTKNSKKNREFRNIEVGDVFWHNGNYYIKIDTGDCLAGVRIATGSLIDFSPNTPVRNHSDSYVVVE